MGGVREGPTTFSSAPWNWPGVTVGIASPLLDPFAPARTHARRSMKPEGIYRPTYRDRHGALKQSTVYWIRFTVRRKRFCFSSKTANREEAKRIRIDKMSEAGRGNLTILDAEKYSSRSWTDRGGRTIYSTGPHSSTSRTVQMLSATSRTEGLGDHDGRDDGVRRGSGGRHARHDQVEFAFLQRGLNLAMGGEARLEAALSFPAGRKREGGILSAGRAGRHRGKPPGAVQAVRDGLLHHRLAAEKGSPDPPVVARRLRWRLATP